MSDVAGELARPEPSPLLDGDARASRGAGSLLSGSADAAAVASSSLKILHVLRAPVGGLFRHVLDVANGQVERGHRVGLIVDSLTGGARADAVLAELAPRLAFGVQRIAIARQLSFADVSALRRVARRVAEVGPDVLHGHGAKGAALVRLLPRGGHADRAIRVYTPHGGSLGYAPGTLAGGFYRALERLLLPRTDLFVFESNYVAQAFYRKVGRPHAPVRIVCNGVGAADFAPIATAPDATDLVCIGELRTVKGVDVLIEALALLKRAGRIVVLTIAGDGPEASRLKALGERLGVADQLRFAGYRPAREAFAMGRVLVVPSRTESLPYVVLEAVAAGMPIIATRVGGIPEIFGAQASRLVAADDAAALAGAIGAALADPAELRRAAVAVNARVRSEFSITAMVDGGIAAYREALATQKSRQSA